MSNWICKYCGEDTSEVDFDYMVGTDHLICVLQSEMEKKVKIENWYKLDSQEFEIRGVPLKVIGTTKIDYRYSMDVYEMVEKQLFIKVDLWVDNKELTCKIFPPNQFTYPPIQLQRYITKSHLKDPTIFLSTICEFILGNKDVRNICDALNDKMYSKNGKSSNSGLNGSAGLFAQTFSSASLW